VDDNDPDRFVCARHANIFSLLAPMTQWGAQGNGPMHRRKIMTIG
jgi:hypothetical protein